MSAASPSRRASARRRLAEHFRRDHDDYNAIMASALADRLAEAFAEYLHKRARTDCGYGADEHLTNDDLIKERYRGIRPAWGYPACPDHTERLTLFDLLDAEKNAGIHLTESLAMYPGAAVSGMYFSHPAGPILQRRQDRARPGPGLRPAQGHGPPDPGTLALPRPELRPGVNTMAQTTPTAAPPSPAALGKMTYEEFLEWADEDTHAEWVDGEIVSDESSFDDHQEIGGFLLAALKIFVQARNLGVIRYESYQMKIGANLPGREPDILFVSNARLTQLKGTYLDGPADLGRGDRQPGEQDSGTGGQSSTSTSRAGWGNTG